MSMGEQPRQVSITAGPASAQIVLDGVDVSKDVAGYQVQQQAGQTPMVVLFPQSDAVVFEGMATVAVAEQAPPGEAIAAFLGGIDPAALDAKVLDGADLDGGPHELTAAMLKQLAAWALGKGD